MAELMGTSKIARAIQYLMRRDGINVHQLSVRASIPASTLYAMLKKNTNEADIQNLKRIADAFGESISIFCGLEEYARPVKLDAAEQQIIDYYRQMNEPGRTRLLEYAAEVGENPRYREE